MILDIKKTHGFSKVTNSEFSRNPLYIEKLSYILVLNTDRTAF